MANIKYFAGTTELQKVWHEGGKRFLGIDPANPPTYDRAAQKWTGYLVADRQVEYKSSPSRHECDARCINATGRIMKCECACGGKNHGRGAFNCEAA